MPSSSLPPSSAPSSPTRTTDDLLALAQQMSPSKPPEALRRIRRNIEARANELRDDVSGLKRRIVDLENQTAATTLPKKRRKRNNRAVEADESVPNPQTVEERTRERGRHFCVSEALFLVNADVFSVEEDEDFDPSTEFDSDANKVQGQLLQIKRYLPDDVKQLRTTPWISGAFKDGMDSQRGSTSNRLRGPSLRNIVDDFNAFGTSAARFKAFAQFIGYQVGNENREPYYHKLDAPVLYEKWEGARDINYFLRGPTLLKIHASIIRGPNGAVGLFEGKSKRPAAKTVERMYKIKRTTLGAIANAACLAIWLHSADTQLVEIGDETGINYRDRHNYYLKCILDGLANDKLWAHNLTAYWDRFLFPDADSPRDSSGMGKEQQLEAQEDEEDFFGSAPSIEKQRPPSSSRTSATPPRPPTPPPPRSPTPPPRVPTPPPRAPTPPPRVPTPPQPRSASAAPPRRGVPRPRRTGGALGR